MPATFLRSFPRALTFILRKNMSYFGPAVRPPAQLFSFTYKPSKSLRKLGQTETNRIALHL